MIRQLKLLVTAMTGGLLLSDGGLCAPAESVNSPLLGISLAPMKAPFDVGQRVQCTLEITNLTSAPVALPSFSFIKNDKGSPYSVVPLYVEEQILRLTVKHGSNVIPIEPHWRNPSKTPGQYPTEQLLPGSVIRKYFPLTVNPWGPSFYALTNPADYTVTIALDTSACNDGQIAKGVWVSPPVAFRIVDFPAFRTRESTESPEAYAQARVAFYLSRIDQHQGEYFANVEAALQTQGAGAALIELMDSLDKRTAYRASELLRQVHHEPGQPNPPHLPGSKAEWSEWWITTGSKLPTGALLGHFYSQFP
jgi:hypothetical protein